MKASRKVYILKSLTWHYNDECTIPGDAKVVTAYTNREAAESARWQREQEARRMPYAEPTYSTTWNAARIADWLRRYDVPEPPQYDNEPLWSHWEWHNEVRTRLGDERYEEFCTMFDVPYFYHVVETELS